MNSMQWSVRCFFVLFRARIKPLQGTLGLYFLGSDKPAGTTLVSERKMPRRDSYMRLEAYLGMRVIPKVKGRTHAVCCPAHKKSALHPEMRGKYYSIFLQLI
jgi:hypothetical protein